MANGFQNFTKVFLVALGRPIPIVILAFGIIIALFLPTVGVIMIPLALFMAVISAWFDTNNPDFIKQVLGNNSDQKQSLKSINLLFEIINKQLLQSSFEEVKFDLNKAKQNLSKIQEILKYLDSVGQSFDAFVLESLNKMVAQLVDLSRQEELARKFLKTEDLNQSILEINDLKNQIAQVTDPVAKKEYEKVIFLKQNQLLLVQSVGMRLERIDSYLARILSSMEQSYSYLTKVGLKDQQDLVDESQVLTDSLESVVADIERFESEMLSVEQKLSVDDKVAPTKIGLKT